MTRLLRGTTGMTLLVLGSVLLSASCAVLNRSAPISSGESFPGDITQGEFPQPSAGAGSPVEEMYDSGYWVTRPRGSIITLIGIAGRRRDKNAAIAEALADAALKAALYHGVYGETAVVLNQGSGNLDYFSDTDYRLVLENNPEAYIGDLIVDSDTDVLEKNGAVYVRARYSGVSDVPAYNSALTNGVPDWVTNYSADIPGFLSAVSYAKSMGSPQRTWRASYENALVSLLPRLASQISNDIVDVQGLRLNQNVMVSRGTLENVMILETWLDKKTGAVWTLLVARERPGG